jgi:hypothetical protein
MPTSNEDKIRCMILSDHYFETEKLETLGQTLKAGHELKLPEDMVRAMLAESEPMFAGLRRERALCQDQEAVKKIQEAAAGHLDKLNSLVESRARYLQALQHSGRTFPGAEETAAIQVVRELSASFHPTNTEYLVGFLLLPIAPELSYAALRSLASGPTGIQAPLVRQRLQDQDPGFKRLIMLALDKLHVRMPSDPLVQTIRADLQERWEAS